MMARRNVTDRAHRYRANALAPAGPKVCAWCGSRENITVDHKDGWPDNTRRSNLQYLCKSHNTAKGIAFRNAGKGRPTKQYNPASGQIPTFEQYAWAVSAGARQWHGESTRHLKGEHDEAGAVIHATPPDVRSEYAQRIAASAKRTKRAKADERWNGARDNWGETSTHYTRRGGGKFQDASMYESPAAARRASLVEARKEKQEARRADQLNRQFLKREKAAERKREAAKPKLQRKFEASQRKSALVPAKRRMSDKGILADLMRNPKRNPADAAADAFKDFHGHASTEEVTVSKKVHRHTHLAAAGELRGLKVDGVDGYRHSIGGLGGAILAFNESRNQLFIEGGDQSIKLKTFGITKPHEVETLGKVTALDYFTNKTHLGDEGGRAVYNHKLRTTNENGRHVVVTIARYPDLIYRVLDQQMEFSGGSYEIRAEGIDK